MKRTRKTKKIIIIDYRNWIRRRQICEFTRLSAELAVWSLECESSSDRPSRPPSMWRPDFLCPASDICEWIKCAEKKIVQILKVTRRSNNNFAKGIFSVWFRFCCREKCFSSGFSFLGENLNNARASTLEFGVGCRYVISLLLYLSLLSKWFVSLCTFCSRNRKQFSVA